MNKHSVVLVTGGTGLVGTALRAIAPEYIYVNSKDANLLCLTETKQLFDRIRPDYIIHLAADVGGLYKNMAGNYTILQNNLQMGINIFECCKLFNVKHGIVMLSTCIFPDGIELPLTESGLHLGPPHPSNVGYSYAKRMLSVMCRTYNHDYQANIQCLIPTNIYGKNDNYHLTDAHVIPALIHKCYLADTTVVIPGTGIAKRQFILDSDLAKIIKRVQESNPPLEFDSLICSGDQEVSIADVVSIISKSFNIRVQYNPSFSDGQLAKTVSNSLLKQLFPDFCFTDLNTGLQSTIEYFRENYNVIRK